MAQPNSQLAILILDDFIDSAETLAVLLRAYGHRARVTNDEFSALAMLEYWPPDVILLDVTIPGLNASMVAGRICSIFSRRPVLIAMSPFSDWEDDSPLADVFDCHVCKPVDPYDLIGIIQTAVDPGERYDEPGL
jgi:CheY-like chemotaxis protein